MRSARRDASRKLAREWKRSLQGPLPDPDDLLARILRAGAPVREQLDEEAVKFLDTKASYWHRKAMQIENDKDHDDYAHYLRLLQQKANFIEFKAAEALLKKRALEPPPDNDQLAEYHVALYRRHRKREADLVRRAIAARDEHGTCMDARDGDVTRPGSPFIPPE